MTCGHLGGGGPLTDTLPSSSTLSPVCSSHHYTVHQGNLLLPRAIQTPELEYGSQFKTYSGKHCSNSLAFIFSYLLIFRYKPIARWRTLTQSCGRKNTHSNWPHSQKKYMKYVARKALMGRTGYIFCNTQCKLKMWVLRQKNIHISRSWQQSVKSSMGPL